MSRIILASASPRRKELLEQIGIVFEIQPAKGEETITAVAPDEVVRELACQKASEIFDRVKEPAVVIGADTIVAMDRQILGKPENEEDAFRMLRLLQGNTHSVYTGVCVMSKGVPEKKITFYEQTKVTMFPMSEREIRDYVASGEPMDKAGAYGIQGSCAAFIKEIHGDYNNVVGLPIARLYQECKNQGIALR